MHLFRCAISLKYVAHSSHGGYRHGQRAEQQEEDDEEGEEQFSNVERDFPEGEDFPLNGSLGPLENGPPAQQVTNFWGNWPSWGAPATQTPRTWRLRRQQRRWPSAAASPFWAGRPEAAPPLLAPEAPGPGGLGGGSPPGRPIPPKVCYLLCWWPSGIPFVCSTKIPNPVIL